MPQVVIKIANRCEEDKVSEVSGVNVVSFFKILMKLLECLSDA